MEQMTLDARFELKALSHEGAFEGYGAVFDAEDQQGDLVARGAFRKTLAAHRGKRRLPALLWQHDTREPIGVWDEMGEDDVGLRVKGRLFIEEIPRARQAHALMKNGGLSGLSIGYRPVASERSDTTGLRRLTEIDLIEVSLVTLPANEAARVTAVKRGAEGRGQEPSRAASEITGIRDFEAFLRDAGGFPRAAAKALAAGGWPALADQRDVDVSALDDLASALGRASETFKRARP